LTHNLFSVITGEHAHWNRLADFFWRVFLPYMIGGVILGLPAAVAIYVTHLPLVRAYQRGRQKRLRQRFEAARARQRATESQPGEPGETS
jgi:hypothetical protein